jgi:hypothetical protein
VHANEGSSKQATLPSNNDEWNLHCFADRFRALVDRVSREFETRISESHAEPAAPPLHHVLDARTPYMTIYSLRSTAVVSATCIGSPSATSTRNIDYVLAPSNACDYGLIQRRRQRQPRKCKPSIEPQQQYTPTAHAVRARGARTGHHYARGVRHPTSALRRRALAAG